MSPAEDRPKRDSAQQLLDNLQDLLQRQVDLLLHGDVAAAERLAKETDTLVLRMTSTSVTEAPAFHEMRPRLERLYERLRLALATARRDARGQIELARKGRRAIRTYHRNLT